MALDKTPWLVGGGAEHSAEVARLLAHVATAGAEGIIGAGSLAVRAQATPGPSVRVAPGAAAILNRYAGGAQQTYVLRNASQTTVPISATGSSGGRTDLVVARILDPQYQGQAPSDPNAFDYSRLEVIEGVPAGTTSAAQLGLSYPAIALARVTLPASTATVTSSMIRDLRAVANPRTEDVWRVRPQVMADGGETLTATREGGEWFPNTGAEQQVFIPEWATRVQMEFTWAGIRYAIGNSWGEMWVEWGPGIGGLNGTQDRQYKANPFPWDMVDNSSVYRTNWICLDDMPIPAALRGMTQTFVGKAKILGGTPGMVSVDFRSGVALKLRFLEAPDASSS